MMKLLSGPLLFAGLLLVMVVVQGCADERPSAVTREPSVSGDVGSESDSVVMPASGNQGTSPEEDRRSGADLPSGSPTLLAAEDLPDGVSEALARDAQGYAEQYGIELSEAITRLQLQEAIGELDAEVTASESGTFAGLWIQHKPEYRVVVAFTRDGESTMGKYVQDGPLREILEVRVAQATLEELERAQSDVSRMVDELGFRLSSGINIQENRVEVYIPDRAKLEKALRDHGHALPDHVVIIGR